MNEMQEQEVTIEGPTKLYEVLGLIEELHDEADLCRIGEARPGCGRTNLSKP